MRKKRVYTIYKHTKGLPYYLDYDLNDYEDFSYFETLTEAQIACSYLNKKFGKEYNYDPVLCYDD